MTICLKMTFFLKFFLLDLISKHNIRNIIIDSTNQNLHLVILLRILVITRPKSKQNNHFYVQQGLYRTADFFNFMNSLLVN